MVETSKLKSPVHPGIGNTLAVLKGHLQSRQVPLAALTLSPFGTLCFTRLWDRPVAGCHSLLHIHPVQKTRGYAWKSLGKGIAWQHGIPKLVLKSFLQRQGTMKINETGHAEAAISGLFYLTQVLGWTKGRFYGITSSIMFTYDQ